VGAREAAVAAAVEGVRGVAAAPGEEAIARRPGVGAVLAAEPDLEAALGQAEVRDPVEADEVAAVLVPAAPVVVADFVAELPAAPEAAEELVAAKEVELEVEMDRQRCHLAATSQATDRAVSGIVRVASVERAVSETGQVVSADREALPIVRVASEDRVELEIAQAESVARVASGIDPVASEDRVASAEWEALAIGRVALVDRVVSETG
jgi:hypothetical protein